MLPLEPINNLAAPAFNDAASCTKWLSQLQLTNLTLAHATLRAQVEELSRCPMRGKDRLQILEVLRESVATVQADSIKKMFGKKLPLADEELVLLITISDLWKFMFIGYLRCWQSLDAGDSSLAAETALLAHRCMLYCGLQIGEFLRMGYEPDAESWQRLHTVYAHIENRGLQREAVSDRFNRTGQAVSCRTLYVKTLLLHRIRLLGLTRNQWHLIDRWFDQWGDTYTVEPGCTMSREDAPPLAVDLSGTRGLVPVQRATSAASMRYMAMVPFSKLIRVKTILLQQGQSPQQLELGDELNSKDCIDLLNRLHACLCERHSEALADEPRDGPSLRLCSGLESIYAHIAHKPFKFPGSVSISEKEAHKQIETFGRLLDDTDRHNLAHLGFLDDEWTVEDDGLLNARLLRKTASHERLGLNQLVCVHKQDAKNFKLGVVTLLNVTRGGQLYIGLRYLPGNPQAVIISGSASGNILSGAAAALLLPEMPNLRIPASLVIPRDWFSTGRRLELDLPQHRNQSVTLGISVDKGNDFERVSFSVRS